MPPATAKSRSVALRRAAVLESRDIENCHKVLMFSARQQFLISALEHPPEQLRSPSP